MTEFTKRWKGGTKEKIVWGGGVYTGVKGGTREKIERLQGEGIYRREEGLRRGKMSEDGYRYCYVTKYRRYTREGRGSDV